MRRLAVRLHLWLGLAIGLVWALQGLTGAALVFHREVDRASRPVVAQGPMVPLSTVVAKVAAHAGVHLQRVGIADGRGDVLLAEYSDAAGVRRSLALEASSARILEAREQEPGSPFTGSASRWLYNLHEALLMGERGETLVGISGLFLLSVLLLGLWIGWPRRRTGRTAFSPRLWRTTQIRLYGWHRMIGLVAGVAMAVTVPGGLYMIFAAELRPAIAGVVPHQPAFVPRPDPSFTTAAISPDEALRRARRHFPDAAFVRIALPSATSPAYIIRLRQKREIRAWSGVTALWIDAGTGDLLSVYDPLSAPLSNRLADAAFSVHSGEIGRLGGRLIVFLAGLSLPVLYVTGCWSWLRKRRTRKARALAAPPASPLSAAE